MITIILLIKNNANHEGGELKRNATKSSIVFSLRDNRLTWITFNG